MLARAIVDKAPSATLLERYAHLAAIRAPGEADPLLAWVLKNPWGVGFVDAGSALLAKSSLFRQRLVIMTAVLEASIDHADEFIEQPAGVVGWFACAAWQVIASGVKVAIGGPIVLALRGRAGTAA